MSPRDKARFTHQFDAFYTRFAGLYDRALNGLPAWRRYLTTAIPRIRGPRVPELCFGTGYLLTQYADRVDTYGLDYNRRMAALAQRRLQRLAIPVSPQEGDVAHLPDAAESFDSVVNTMDFSAQRRLVLFQPPNARCNGRRTAGRQRTAHPPALAP